MQQVTDQQPARHRVEKTLADRQAGVASCRALSADFAGGAQLLTHEPEFIRIAQQRDRFSTSDTGRIVVPSS